MSLLIKTRSLTIGGIEITIRDLPWPAMKEFLDLISRHVKALIGEAVRTASSSPDPRSQTPDPRFIGAAVMEQLPALITDTTELAEYLVLKCTGRDAAWLQQVGSTEFMALLEASLDVVFSDEFLKLGKGAGGRVAEMFNLKALTALSPNPLTSSSPRAGAGRTPMDLPLPSSASSATSPPTASSPAEAPSAKEAASSK